MIHINLLPHREARRAADFRQSLGLLGLGAVIEFGAIWYLGSGIQEELVKTQASVRQLEQDIEQYKPQEAKVEEFRQVRSHLEEKLGVIDGLERNRSGPVRMLDEIASHTPDRLWLTGIQTTGNDVTLEGESLDTGTVANLLKGLNQSAYFTQVDLEKTVRGKEIEGVKLVNFTITAKLVVPDEKQAEPEAAAAAEPGGDA